ncbi:MAG: SusF/SusE family outer membrane protein, partial [Dysgonamonadaceae bacterium]|nr:SusF/SusE family outer membrane protein [Dysgonamonadaceae bacterium]
MKQISLLIISVFSTLVPVFSQAVYDHLYVVGNACSAGWNPDAAPEMTQIEAGVFKWTGALEDYTGDNGNRRFKFLIARNWEVSITVGDPAAPHKRITSGVEEELRVNTGSGADNAFQVPVTAEYEVVVNLNTMKMTCTQTSEVDPNALDLNHLYLVGGAVPCGWSAGASIEMTKISEGVFVWACLITPRADGSDPAMFKFLNRQDWAFSINPADNNIEFVPGVKYDLTYRDVDRKFIVTETTAGLYTVQVDLNTIKVVFNKVPDLTQLYMVGDATPAGWSNTQPEAMTFVSDGIFTWSGALSMGQFKFLNEAGTWSKSINPTTDIELQVDTEYELRYRPVEATPNDKKFIITTPGNYAVNVNLNTLKMVCSLISANDTASVISILGGNISECGRTSKLSIGTTPANAWFPPIVWSVDNETVAFIGANGKLYPKANGTVTVTASATLDDGTILSDSKEFTISGQSINDYSLAIMGSSVPSGSGADAGKGYAQLAQQYLENDAVRSWNVSNISIGGNNTTDVINRWDNDFLPSCSRYIYYGLSLGNEGIHERGQTAFDSYRDNMQLLINRARDAGKLPLMGNNYPRGDFNATDYAFVKQLNLLIHEWDVPSVNLLGAIDNGAGQWADGYIADNSHPNTAGHAEMFY